MNKQIFIYGLSESGEVHHRTIFDREFEHYEKQGYKRNPIELPNSVEKLSAIVVKNKRQQKEELESTAIQMEKAGDEDRA